MRSAPGRCPVSRANSPSWGVSTVGAVRPVQHGARRRRRSRPARTARRRRRPAAPRRAPRPSRARGDGVVGAARGPGRRTSGVEAVEAVEHGRPTSRTPAARRRTTSAAAPSPSTPGRRQRHHARAGPLRGRATARWAAPVMPGLPATTRTAAAPLVGVGGRGPPPAGDVGGLDEVGGRARRVSRPMSTTSTSPASVAPGAEQQARLEGGERDRAVGRQHAAARPRRSARRRRTGCRRPAPARRPTSRRPPVAAEAGAVGGVDHEVGRRQHAAGSRRRRPRAPARPRRASEPAGGPAVVAVVALAGDHDDPCGRRCRRASGGPARADGRAGPLDQHLDRLGRGGVDRPPSRPA